jgi:hypothetical protein
MQEVNLALSFLSTDIRYTRTLRLRYAKQLTQTTPECNRYLSASFQEVKSCCSRCAISRFAIRMFPTLHCHRVPSLCRRPFIHPYMHKQTTVSTTGHFVVDWLVEVHMKFRLVTETLYLSSTFSTTISPIDVERSRLQRRVTAHHRRQSMKSILRRCVTVHHRPAAFPPGGARHGKRGYQATLQLSVPTGHPFFEAISLYHQCYQDDELCRKLLHGTGAPEHGSLATSSVDCRCSRSASLSTTGSREMIVC